MFCKKAAIRFVQTPTSSPVRASSVPQPPALFYFLGRAALPVPGGQQQRDFIHHCHCFCTRNAQVSRGAAEKTMSVNECHRVRVTSSTSSAVNSSEGLLKENKRQLQPMVDQKLQYQITEPLPKEKTANSPLESLV